MQRLFLSTACMAGLVLLTGPVQAQEVSLVDAEACLMAAETSQQSAICIRDAHAPCKSIDGGTPSVATLCYVNAKGTWSEGIAALVTGLTETNSEEIAAIASVEVKYDLLTALLQCDRLEELQLIVGRDSEDDILLQNAECEAQASALTYTRLLLRARDL